MISNKFRMVCKVYLNLQLDSRDWSMYSSILNTAEPREKIVQSVHIQTFNFLKQVETVAISPFNRTFRAQTMKIGPRITFLLNISNLSKNYLKDFFYSVSNFGTGMVQLKCQRAKRLKFSFLVL